MLYKIKVKSQNLWLAVENGTGKYFLGSKKQAVNIHYTRLDNVLKKLKSLYDYKFAIKYNKI